MMGTATDVSVAQGNNQAAPAEQAAVQDAQGSQTAQEQPVTPAAQDAPKADDADIFGEAISEAELVGTGDDVGKQEVTDKAENHGENKDADPDAKGNSADEQHKPPKGYVPHAALAEERAKRKAAQQRVEEMEQSLAQKRQQEEAWTQQATGQNLPEPEGLSEDVRQFVQDNPEYRNIAFEDSKDGKVLRDKIDAYGADEGYAFAKTLTVDRALLSQKQQNVAHEQNSYFTSCLQEMDKLFDGGLQGEEAKNVVEYLQNDAGLSADTITLLSTPHTIIIDPRTGKQAYLGKKAIEIAGLFKESHSLAKNSDPNKLTAELTASLEQKITKQVLEKMNGSADRFVDIGSAPGHDGEEYSGKAPLTEADFGKLSPEQQERYLRGM